MTVFQYITILSHTLQFDLFINVLLCICQFPVQFNFFFKCALQGTDFAPEYLQQLSDIIVRSKKCLDLFNCTMLQPQHWENTLAYTQLFMAYFRKFVLEMKNFCFFSFLWAYFSKFVPVMKHFCFLIQHCSYMNQHQRGD